MSYTFRASLPTLCLALILPCALPVMAASPAPDKDSATKTAPPPERQLLLERSQEDAAALQRQLPPAEVQQLQAGDETFLALWKPANIDQPKGAVIIIPGADESADWPQVVGPLRRRFPDEGWGSLSLTLPDAPNSGSLPRVEETVATAPAKDAKVVAAPKSAEPENTAEADAAASVARAAAADEQAKAEAERIFARIESGVAYAQQQKARSIVLLGHGSGAYWAARFLGERPSPLIQKLILVSAQEPLNAKPPLSELATTLKVKTADFVYKDFAQNLDAAQQRLQASKRSKNINYTQVALTTLPGDNAAQQEQLFRRVRGWLEPK
ncbi:alpha/beta hydrolase family protein [Pseudomonas sp. CCI3.2]|uniref:alpha/beta hydrolase family protein n=1 Tax=unclassified Pseudomonas TaxID=196821 RepID=UPI002AC92712|nr:MULTISPECIES: alpha/beta hydrolase family protein [unclassified Pseudomonas]MEB0079793.1 alpha/beta hydrolase family protein [Pseudomonas sp. MH10out]MEB0091982.1 alpha/beta hydrolase family protein [Pseudomonas sp. CCI4.2]MEB0103144.1 alpha/beta hydrolase family protein [Pseudomonas sp. CCI3.2]MEB0122271.1 alpha/beta hydrolase family protein [Pseudomonas sp. CCI1.2]MEB0132673.1 alpha/beta hydrolase family protein [Pseudomonas sp. CCI2.4]